MRQAEPRHADQPVDVRLEHYPLVLLGAGVERIAAQCKPGGVDEDVDAAQLLRRFGHETLAALRVGDVELQRRDGRRDPVDAARPADDAGTLAGKGLRGRRADPARRPGDDRRPSLQLWHRATLTALERGPAGLRRSELDRLRGEL